MSNLRDKKCSRCNCYRKEEDFISNERIIKSCIKCRNIQKKYADKEEIKEKQKKYRNEHKEELIKYHKQHNNKNKEKIAEYKKKYDEQQKINNPLHIKFTNMIKSSIKADKKHNRTYKEEDFITEDFLNELWVKQNEKCYYEDCECKLTLEFNKDFRNPTQISVQRINNDIAHIQSNCVLSCYKCNVSNMENEKLYKKMIERVKQYQ